jgi:hypothetical protein
MKGSLCKKGANQITQLGIGIDYCFSLWPQILVRVLPCYVERKHGREGGE